MFIPGMEYMKLWEFAYDIFENCLFVLGPLESTLTHLFRALRARLCLKVRQTMVCQEFD